MGQASSNKLTHIRDIIHNVHLHRIVPGLAVAVGSFGGDKAGSVELAVAAGVVGLAELRPQGFVRDKDIGHLQSRNIKGLAGGGGRDGKRCKGRVDLRKHLMLALPDEICVDLIAEDGHAVALADAAHLQQFFPAPHAAHRVVGAAQQKQLDMVFNNFTLKIRKVDSIMSGGFVQHQVTGDQPASVIHDDLAERIVHRLLDEHRVPGLGAGLDRHRNGKHDARRLLQPVGLYLPAVVGSKPLLHGLKVGGVRLGIAVNCMSGLADEGILDVGGHLKVHIRHPQGQHTRRAAALDGKIIFQALGAPPVKHGVKIQIAFAHGGSLPYKVL